MNRPSRSAKAEALIFDLIEDLRFCPDDWKMVVVKRFLRDGHPRGIELSDLREAMERAGCDELQIEIVERFLADYDPVALELEPYQISNEKLVCRLSVDRVSEILADPLYGNFRRIFVDGEELWYWESGWTTLGGRGGFAVTRSGQCVACIVTVLS